MEAFDNIGLRPLGYGKSLHDALPEVHARAVAGDVAKPREAPRLVDTRQLTGRDADFVEIYNLDEGKRVPRSVDEELIEAVRGVVQRAARSLRENSFDPQPERAKCSKCDYLAFCIKGQAKLGRNGTKGP
jgi:hypothetical protein